MITQCAAATIALLVFASTAGAAPVPVPIINSGFENPLVGVEGDYTDTIIGWSVVNGGDTGVWNVETTDYPAQAPEGSNVAFVYDAASVAGCSQTLSGAMGQLQADASYTLTVKVGDSLTYAFPGYKVQLLADGTVLAEDDNTQVPANGTFTTSTVNYTYNAGLHAALVGLPLEIRLLSKGLVGGEVEFDNVQLTATLGKPVAAAGGPYAVLSIGSLALNGSGSQPSDGQTITEPTGYEWDLNIADNGGAFNADLTGATPTAISYAALTSSYGMTPGDNTIKLRVTDSAAKTSTSTATVTLTVASSNADLSNLETSPVMVLTPFFDSAVLNYTAAVTYATASVTVKPVKADAGATITVDGSSVASGTSSAPIPLNVGTNTIITVVTAENTTTQRTYTLTVTRGLPSSNANLADLTPSDGTLMPSFNSGILTYAATVPYPTSSITLTPLAANAGATIKVNDNSVVPGNPSSPVPLTVGANPITTVVTAEDGITTQTYALTVTREPDTAPPVIATLNPADDSTAASNINLVVTFDEPVTIGTGTIIIRNTDPSPASDVVIEIGSPQVSVAGAVLTINPIAELVVGKNYAIRIAAGAIKDLFNNPFGGITDDTTWNFTATFPTYFWLQTTGGAQDWTTAANWLSGDIPSPVPGATVDFSTVNIAANTTLTLGGDRTAEMWKFGDTVGTHTWSVSAGNKMVLAGVTTPTIQVNNSTTTLNNVVDGTAGLTKTGGGTLVLAGSNSYTGGTILNAGTISAANNSALGTGTVTLTGNATLGAAYLAAGYTIPNAVVVNDGVTATFNPGNQYQKLTITGPFSGSGAANFTTGAGGAAGSLTFSSSLNTFTGLLKVVYIGNGGGGLTVNSLADSTNPIQLTGNANPAIFALGAGTASPLLFNNRQIELNGTLAGGGIINNNNATVGNTITINTDLLVSAGGNKKLTLGGSNTGNNTFAGKIVDSTTPAAVISLAKADAGTWILSGANTHSGATTVSAGKLVMVVGGSCANSDVTVSGGTLSISITDNTKQWACKSLSHMAASVLNFDFGATVPSATVAPVVATGNVTFSTAPTLSCTGTGLTGLAPGLYPLITWTGTVSGTVPGSVTLPSGIGVLIRDDTTKTLWLNILGSRGAVTWQGPAGSEWKANESSYTYWQDATLATTYYQENTVGGVLVGDSVVFGATGAGTVVLNTMLAPAAVSVNVASPNGYTFSGIGGIAGGGGLTKAGTGTLTLANSNTFSGATFVGAGTLALAHADAISASSGMVVQGGNATVDVSAGLKSLVFDSTTARTVSGTGTLAFAPGATIRTSDNRVNCTITTSITGSPAVETKDSGATNTYLGLVFAPASGTQTLGAVLNPNNTGTTDKAGVTLGGSTTGNSVVSIDYAGTDQYADVVKAGTGTWTTGNIRTGTIRFNQGTLIINGTVTAMYNGFVYTAGTLKGNASLRRNDRRGNHEFLSGFIVAPGNGVGTITILDGTTQTPTAAQQYTTFKAGSIYEWEVGPVSQDKVHIAAGKLQLDGFTLKIRDAGGAPAAGAQLPVFTYDPATVTTRTLALGSVVFDTTDLAGKGWTIGTLALTDDGNGTIYLTGLSKSVAGFASWKTINGATGQTLGQDHDGDGVPNGVEFFLVGPSGNSTGFTALPGVVKDSVTGALSVTWPKGSGYTGVYPTDFVVETSETLTGAWTAETVGGTVTDSATQVKYTFPSPLGTKKFARLKVTGP